MSRWNAVSKHATCGMSHRAPTASMPDDRGRQVQRRERHELAELGEHVVVDERGLGVVRAAVHDAVAGRAGKRQVPLVESDECGVERAVQ